MDLSQSAEHGRLSNGHLAQHILIQRPRTLQGLLLIGAPEEPQQLGSATLVLHQLNWIESGAMGLSKNSTQ